MFEDIFAALKAAPHPLKDAIKNGDKVYRIKAGATDEHSFASEVWRGTPSQYLDLACGLIHDNEYDAHQTAKHLTEQGMLIAKLILRDQYVGIEHTLEEEQE